MENLTDRKRFDTQAEAIQLDNELKDCYYNCLIPMAKKIKFFDAFKYIFPQAKRISSVKKVDFYLWTA